MSRLVYKFLKLVLTSLFDFIQDYIYEYPGLSKSIAKEDLKFFLRDRYNDVAINPSLILLPVV